MRYTDNQIIEYLRSVDDENIRCIVSKDLCDDTLEISYNILLEGSYKPMRTMYVGIHISVIDEFVYSKRSEKLNILL